MKFTASNYSAHRGSCLRGNQSVYGGAEVWFSQPLEFSVCRWPSGEQASRLRYNRTAAVSSAIVSQAARLPCLLPSGSPPPRSRISVTGILAVGARRELKILAGRGRPARRAGRTGRAATTWWLLVDEERLCVWRGRGLRRDVLPSRTSAVATRSVRLAKTRSETATLWRDQPALRGRRGRRPSSAPTVGNLCVLALFRG